MQTPDPLPQPGAWLVMADGSVYEVVEPGTRDPGGVYYLSVDSGETIWTPWSDVESVGTYAEVDAIAADIVERETRRLMYPDAAPARVIAHTTRWEVTIYHAPGVIVPDYLRGAVQNVIQAALRAAGIDDAAVLISDEAP